MKTKVKCKSCRKLVKPILIPSKIRLHETCPNCGHCFSHCSLFEEMEDMKDVIYDPE